MLLSIVLVIFTPRPPIGPTVPPPLLKASPSVKVNSRYAGLGHERQIRTILNKERTTLLFHANRWPRKFAAERTSMVRC